MANTYTLIASSTVGSGGVADITFSSIPSTYTDLKVVVSARTTQAGNYQNVRLSFNGSSSTYSERALRSYGGSTVDSVTGSSSSYISNIYQNSSGSTANTFSNYEFYVPNYTSTSNAKSVSIDTVAENNASDGFVGITAGLWNPASQAAITSITLTQAAGTIVEYSTAYLYGIKNS